MTCNPFQLRPRKQMEKQQSERLEPKSFDKVSSDVSEQFRRVSVITQKKLLSDLAQSLGRKRSQKDTTERSITIQRQEYDKHSNFYNHKGDKKHLCSILDVINAD